MDLSKLDLEVASADGVEVEILHPITNDILKSDNGEPVIIRIYGTESKQFKAAAKAERSKWKGKSVDPSSDEFNESMIKVLAKSTIEWSGVEWEGEPLECNYKNALKLYSNGGLSWLSKQLLAASGDHTLIPLGQESG